MGKKLVGCPECGEPRFYMGGSVCTSCDWHGPGQTLLHANFARDPECRWCVEPSREPDERRAAAHELRDIGAEIEEATDG